MLNSVAGNLTYPDVSKKHTTLGLVGQCATKAEGTTVPPHTMKAYGGRYLLLHLFLTSTLDGQECSKQHTIRLGSQNHAALQLSLYDILTEIFKIEHVFSHMHRKFVTSNFFHYQT